MKNFKDHVRGIPKSDLIFWDVAFYMNNKESTFMNTQQVGKFEKFLNFLEKFYTTKDGAVSSKIVVGAITYFILVISIVVLMFVKPEFPGLQEIVIVLILSSTSLLGLTTVENIKDGKWKKGKENIGME